jgi:hypothetical protein
MPKSRFDPNLQFLAKHAIHKYHTVEGAANAVGLSSATLWRVARSGRAIPRTRAILETWSVKSPSNEINEMTPRALSTMTLEDLLRARGVLLTMVQFLDNYIVGASATATEPSHEVCNE